MKALVTGGAGFIGSHIVDKLLQSDCEVIVIDDFSTGKEENLRYHKNLQIVKKSICEDLSNYFANIDVVFHLAAIPQVQFSIENPIKTHEVNVNGTLNVLESSRKAGVKRFIFSSSSAVYGDQPRLPLEENMTPNPLSPYAAHKLIGEYYCGLYTKIYGMECVSLRYFNVFGPRQNPNGNYACLIPKFITLINEDKIPVINGDGEQTRDFIYIDDVVDANIKAASTNNRECFGHVFNIGSGEKFSVNQIAGIILDLSGKKIKAEHGPSMIEPKNTLANINKAKKLLDWKPKVEFNKGLEETNKFFK